MNWDQIIVVSIGPLIGLIGVAYSLARNYHLGEESKRNQTDRERKALAAGLYAELVSAKADCLGKLIALQGKAKGYTELGKNPKTENKNAKSKLLQYLPAIDRTIYVNNANLIGLLEPENAASVSLAYSQIEVAKKTFLIGRKIRTNKDLEEAVPYLCLILERSNEVLDSAIKALKKHLPTSITDSPLFKSTEAEVSMNETSEKI